MKISNEIIEKAKILMQEATEINKAPAWGLTEIAIEKGKLLANEYNIDSSLVVTALYLAHVVFSSERNSDIMKNHTQLSAQKAGEVLAQWGVRPEDTLLIQKAISLHHTAENSGNLFCEVVKNAECFKFLTKEGIEIFIKDLEKRKESDIVEFARYKMNQKYKYLTLEPSLIEAKKLVPKIEHYLDFLGKNNL